MKIKAYILPIITLCVLKMYSQVIDPASLPDVEDYIEIRTNPQADTVIIGLHGGPTDRLLPGSFQYLEDIPTFSVVEVLKYEMLHPILKDSTLTLEEANAANDTTAALIEKVVQYYNEQGKIVVLTGFSWGAIVLGEYLDDYGASKIHRIIPMEGRLNMQLEMVDYLLDGYLPTFQSDGLTLELTTPQFIYAHGLRYLAAAIFSNRWVDSLDNMDLSKMMYTYSENDMQTGALTIEETDFLNNSGAEILFTPNAGHGGTFSVENQSKMIEFIRGEIFVGIQQPIVKNNLKLYPTLASNSIKIESEQKGKLEIFDINGRLVYQRIISVPFIQVDVSNFNNGMYIAVFQNSTFERNVAKFHVTKQN